MNLLQSEVDDESAPNAIFFHHLLEPRNFILIVEISWKPLSEGQKRFLIEL